MTTTNEGVRREAMVELRDLYDDHFPIIGIGSNRVVWAANTRIENVPNEITTAGAYRAWGHALFLEQFYIKQEP